jgi:hypothetical protein
VHWHCGKHAAGMRHEPFHAHTPASFVSPPDLLTDALSLPSCASSLSPENLSSMPPHLQDPAYQQQPPPPPETATAEATRCAGRAARPAAAGRSGRGRRRRGPGRRTRSGRTGRTGGGERVGWQRGGALRRIEEFRLSESARVPPATCGHPPRVRTRRTRPVRLLPGTAGRPTADGRRRGRGAGRLRAAEPGSAGARARAEIPKSAPARPSDSHRIAPPCRITSPRRGPHQRPQARG